MEYKKEHNFLLFLTEYLLFSVYYFRVIVIIIIITIITVFVTIIMIDTTIITSIFIRIVVINIGITTYTNHPASHCESKYAVIYAMWAGSQYMALSHPVFPSVLPDLCQKRSCLGSCVWSTDSDIRCWTRGLDLSIHSPPPPTPGQIGHHFADDAFRCILVNDKFCTLTKISLNFVPKGPIDNNPTFV